MTCPRHDELSAYADLVMKPGERARFDQHLQACPICQLQLEDLQVLRQGLRALPSPTLGFDLASRLEDRLRHQAQRRHRPWPAHPGRRVQRLSTGCSGGNAERFCSSPFYRVVGQPHILGGSKTGNRFVRGRTSPADAQERLETLRAQVHGAGLHLRRQGRFAT